MSYYTTVIVITLMTLAVLAELVRENNRMSAGRRTLCYAEFSLIAASALGEWLGVALAGVRGVPGWAILVAKWADYTLTPLAGGAITWQLRLHNGWEKALNALLVFNAVFQTIAFATGNMLILDEANHYSYTKLHLVYVVIYLTVFFLTIIQFIFYGRNFERQNQGSLYMTVMLAVGGVSLQECLGGQVRVAYLSLAIGAALLYIRNGEFFQLAQDESIETQRELLMVDDLTDVGSRRAYSVALEELTKSGVPDDLVIFCADINGLKETNDTLGHAAGDKLIVAAADCIQAVLSSAGRCFRTGGDEFVALVHMSAGQAADAMAALERAASKYTSDAGQTLTFACGYACARDWPGMEPHKLVRRADLAMYEAKEAYYLKEGKERRRS